MSNLFDPHAAWLTSNTPTLWAFVSRQRQPLAQEHFAATDLPQLPPSSLEDTLQSLPLREGYSRTDISRVCEVRSDQEESHLFNSLKSIIVQNPASAFFIVRCADWLYLPSYKAAVRLIADSRTSQRFLRLPVLALDGVELLQEAFERDPKFRPGRIDSILLQCELLQGKALSVADVIKERQWNDELTVCLGLPSLFESQKREVEARGLKELYRLSREAQEPIALCQAVGCAFDVEAHSSLVSLWKVRLQNYEREARAVFGDTNIASNPQLSHALTTYLQRIGETGILRLWPKTSTKLLKTNVATLRLFCMHPSLASMLELIVSYRTLQKVDNHFGQVLQTHVRGGRLHSLYKLNGCVTGRLSSSEPNLQNIPRTPEFRKLFTASCGCVLVVGDFSQIELRMAAVLSRDPIMLACYRSSEDLHRLTACTLLSVPPDAVTAEQRRLAKAVNFGTLYGQGAKGLAKYCRANYEVDISEEDAQKYIVKFREKFHALRKWQEQILASPVVSTPLGRKRPLKGLRDNEKLNMPIQGGAAEVMLLALVYCHRAVRRFGAVLVNAIHDEVVLEVPRSAVTPCVDAVKTAMNRAFADYCDFLGVAERWDVADVQSGDHWGCKG